MLKKSAPLAIAAIAAAISLTACTGDADEEIPADEMADAELGMEIDDPVTDTGMAEDDLAAGDYDESPRD